MSDITIIDTAGLAILGNDDFLLRLMRGKASQNQINAYVAWTLHTCKCLGLKVINTGGANAFKANFYCYNALRCNENGNAPALRIKTLERLPKSIGCTDIRKRIIYIDALRASVHLTMLSP